ncbi:MULTISPECIES: PilN domain-containing protein [Neptunomonas]|uniref:Pilus assembly protein PilN n=1 Tax=Neptunomonas marina TaxID=1815562 RepID=A0A437QAC1_9GAMM|nr:MULTISPECIES: PilN domain-containing protein [Neptunomonas]RVU31465.1 pilus assembly protein PilN [Neptunomonas marina]
MAKINLRPWREERAAAKQKEFVTNVAASALFGLALVLLVGYYYDVQFDRQVARNDYLKSEIAKLDLKIEEIEDLKKQRERLLERLNAIQELQGNRPIIVRNFDELVRVLPDGLHYVSLERSENGFDDAGQASSEDAIKISGLVHQNEDVSELMRNLNDSIWFGEPDLSVVERLDEKNSKVVVEHQGQNMFNLVVDLAKPKAEEAE